MKKLLAKQISCPHCGHYFYIDLDISGGDQDYYEPCSACYNHIHLSFHLNENQHVVELHIEG